jgi:hypothetical protein
MFVLSDPSEMQLFVCENWEFGIRNSGIGFPISRFVSLMKPNCENHRKSSLIVSSKSSKIVQNELLKLYLKYLKRLMNSFCGSHSWVGWLLYLNAASFKEPPLNSTIYFHKLQVLSFTSIHMFYEPVSKILISIFCIVTGIDAKVAL